MKNLFLKDAAKSINDLKQPLSYKAIAKVLHELDNKGEPELEDLKMGYIRNELSEREKAFMTWHLLKCKTCSEDILLKAKITYMAKINEISSDSKATLTKSEIDESFEKLFQRFKIKLAGMAFRTEINKHGLTEEVINETKMIASEYYKLPVKREPIQKKLKFFYIEAVSKVIKKKGFEIELMNSELIYKYDDKIKIYIKKGYSEEYAKELLLLEESIRRQVLKINADIETEKSSVPIFNISGVSITDKQLCSYFVRAALEALAIIRYSGKKNTEKNFDILIDVLIKEKSGTEIEKKYGMPSLQILDTISESFWNLYFTIKKMMPLTDPSFDNSVKLEVEVFEHQIHDYFTHTKFDYENRNRMESIYFEVDELFQQYIIAKMMHNKDLKKEIEKNLGEIIIIFIDLLLSLRKFDMALEVLEEPLKKDPENLITLGQLCKIYIYKRDMDKAEAIIKDVLEKYPNSEYFLDCLLNVYTIKRRFAEAEKIIKKLLEKNTDRVSFLNNVGHFYLEQKKIARAKPYIIKAFEKNPFNPEILCNLGRVYLNEKQYGRALQYLTESNELLPKQPYTMANLSECYAKTLEFDKAEEVIIEAVELDPENPIILLSQGNLKILLSQGNRKIRLDKVNEALPILEKANTLDPENSYILNGLGIVYSEIGKYQQSEIVLKKAELLDPESSSINNNLALLYYNIGRIELAKKYIKTAKTLDPENLSISDNYDAIMGTRQIETPIYMI